MFKMWKEVSFLIIIIFFCLFKKNLSQNKKEKKRALPPSQVSSDSLHVMQFFQLFILQPGRMKQGASAGRPCCCRADQLAPAQFKATLHHKSDSSKTDGSAPITVAPEHSLTADARRLRFYVSIENFSKETPTGFIFTFTKGAEKNAIVVPVYDSQYQNALGELHWYVHWSWWEVENKYISVTYCLCVLRYFLR